MFEAVESFVTEYADVEARLADPGVHADPGAAKRLGRRYAELSPVIAAYRAWQAASGDAQAARELAEHDESFAAELPHLEAAAEAAAARLHDVAAAARPGRRPRRDPRGQGRRGRRGVGAVRG